MRRRMTYRPSKGACLFGGGVGIIFVLIGVTTAVPVFGAFGVLWTLVALGITIYYFALAFGKGSVGSVTIEEEPAAGPGPSPAPAPDASARLEQLRSLYDQRLITQEEYEEKRKEILKEL